MTERENEIVAEKIFEAWNRHDLEAFMSHFSDDLKVVWTGGRTVDKKGFHSELSNYHMTAFPDSNFRIDRMVSHGNMVWLEHTETGTHKGEFHGIPATNKKFEYQAVMIFDFEAGKVKLWKLYLDLQSILNQLNE